MISALDALERLRAGNRRYVAGESENSFEQFSAARNQLVESQAPFAAVLGCSDSRVPVELIFDQGLGSLFVIRIAGNIAYPSQIGSVEFAAAELGTPLVVVLGHSDCGAVKATIQSILEGERAATENLGLIVERIRPVVSEVVDKEAGSDSLLDSAVRANVVASAARLCNDSELLRAKIDAGDLLVVGAEYSLASGKVDFFDGVGAA